MSDPTPLGTVPRPEPPELANLKEREKGFVDKLAKLEKMDANEVHRAGFDINEIKRRAQLQLADIRKEIQKQFIGAGPGK